MRHILLSASVALVCVATSSAVADVTRTTNPADLTANVFIDFEGVPFTDLSSLASPLDLNPVIPAALSASPAVNYGFGTIFLDDPDEGFEHQLQIALGGALGAPESLTFTFDQPLFGFGATFEGVDFQLPDPNPTIAQITIAGETFLLEDGFVGFVSDTAFTTVTLSIIDPPGGFDFEIYSLDDIVLQTVVPEPASLSLLALAALGLKRRRA